MANKLFSQLCKNTYVGATAYTVGDIVDYNGSSYACKVNTTGNLPTDTTKWALLASKGDTGAKGDKGDTSTITVGTVTTGIPSSPVTFVNVGTATDAIFDISIPKGDTGATGAGTGDVLGPATNTDSYIPQWDGANSKTLKDGVAVPAGGLAGLTALGDKVDKATLDANTILYATTDNTPAALAVGASTIVGRKASGDIVALTATETRTILNVADGATANAKATQAEIVTGTDDTKFATALAVQPYSNQSLYRQAIINGNFDVWQRGTSLGTGYTADRWFMPGASGALAERSTDTPTGYGYSIKITHTGGSNWILQKIESVNSAKLAGQNVTVSFWAKSISGSVAGVIEVVYANVIDNFSAVTTIGTSNITYTSSWAKYTFTVAIPAGAANGIQLRIVTGADANAAIANIAQVQLCAGSVALPFQPKSFAEELRDCQRYYEKSWLYGIAEYTATAGGYEQQYALATTVAAARYTTVRYTVPKRTIVTPVICPFTTPTNTGRISDTSGTDLGANSGAVITGSNYNFSVWNNSGGNLTTGGGIIFHWIADAEL